MIEIKFNLSHGTDFPTVLQQIHNALAGWDQYVNNNVLLYDHTKDGQQLGLVIGPDSGDDDVVVEATLTSSITEGERKKKQYEEDEKFNKSIEAMNKFIANTKDNYK